MTMILNWGLNRGGRLSTQPTTTQKKIYIYLIIIINDNKKKNMRDSTADGIRLRCIVSTVVKFDVDWIQAISTYAERFLCQPSTARKIYDGDIASASLYRRWWWSPVTFAPFKKEKKKISFPKKCSVCLLFFFVRHI